ncbi:MAG: ABC transporter ATP-binding protein [Pseudomonadota bacterium]
MTATGAISIGSQIQSAEAASPPAALAFDDVWHRFGAVDALRGITLDIAPAERLCLLGESGCGKTTLLRIAAGVIEQASGQVFMDGRAIAGPNLFLPPERRGVGLMFQDYALFPHMTIVQNVMFGLTGMAPKAARTEAVQALSRVSLERYAKSYPHALSGGEQQRVALARAIAPRPSIFLMDEPFSGLDARLRDSVRDETMALLREIRSTCMIVTHDAEEAMRIGDRIALMREGRIVQVGTPEALYQSPESLFAARFFSELNECSAILDDGVADTPLGRFAAPAVVGGLASKGAGKAIAAIRPADVRLREDGGASKGKIVRRQFLGDADLLEIVVDGGDLIIKVRSGEVGRYREGDVVGLDIDERKVLVFADQPS